MIDPHSTHLFISYAAEDLPLARWLAGRLAARGHLVWFEKMKSLSGEPWPETAEDTIKNHTFRMLALISAHSLRKKKPALERMLAQRVVRQQNIPDFLIPLKVDDSAPDPLLDMESAISFEDDWMEGWKALLKRLDSIKAPHTPEKGPQLVASGFARGARLVSASGERLFANLIRIKSFPGTLRVFQAADDMDADEWEALEDTWTFYAITKDVLVAVIPQPPEFGDRIRPTRELLDWTKPGRFRNIRIRDLAGAVIVQALARRLVRAGCQRHPDPEFKNIFYLPEDFVENGRVECLGAEGKPIHLPIRNKVAFRRLGGNEVNFHHFAFSVRAVYGLDQGYSIQLTPTLVFFDEQGRPVDDPGALSRLRQVRRTWDNQEWLNRILAAEHVLAGAPVTGMNDPVLEPGLVRLDATAGLEESVLESGAAAPAESLGQEFELEEAEREREEGQ